MEHIDPTGSIQWFATLGVGGILACFMFLFYRKDVKDLFDRAEKVAARGQEQFDLLLHAFQENSTAMTALQATIEALHRRDDRIEEALNRQGFNFPHRPPPDSRQ